ncbi:MAG: DUF4276 family protein [Dehalococcoidia bacterium]|nr:MAG: DUF4276 family protein [Dehalococcoidia bacterium]
MSRLFVHVEGVAEEAFVSEVLRQYLYGHGYTDVTARLIGNARIRERRGGIRSWQVVRKDIINHLKEDQSCFTTTMVDYYALPKNGDDAWPGRQEASDLPFPVKAATVENALSEDILRQLGSDFDSRRFIPYVMIHEFEALLFSDCTRFAQGIGLPDLAPAFQAIRNQFATPEEINDSPVTAPSKRVEALVPGYSKPFQGCLAILEIGLDTIKNECPHFKQWLKILETRA